MVANLRTFTYDKLPQLRSRGLQFLNAVSNSLEHEELAYGEFRPIHERVLDEERVGKNRQIKLMHTDLKEREDESLSHSPRWHQFSIYEHTKNVLKAFEEWLDNKGRFDAVNPRVELEDIKTRRKLCEKIDGIEKKELLFYAMLYHDLGKYAPLIERSNDSGKLVLAGKERLDLVYFKHEELSGKMLSSPELDFIKEMRDELNFTDAQIQYVIDMARYHYQMLKVNSQTFQIDGENNRLAYILKGLKHPNSNKDFEQNLKEYFDENPALKKYQHEIALMFVFDTLGKLDTPPDHLMDLKDIEKTAISRENKGLADWAAQDLKNASLALGAKNLPVNLMIAKKTLELVNRD